jgi:hypothetical protein
MKKFGVNILFRFFLSSFAVALILFDLLLFPKLLVVRSRALYAPLG